MGCFYPIGQIRWELAKIGKPLDYLFKSAPLRRLYSNGYIIRWNLSQVPERSKNLPVTARLSFDVCQNDHEMFRTSETGIFDLQFSKQVWKTTAMAKQVASCCRGGPRVYRTQKNVVSSTFVLHEVPHIVDLGQKAESFRFLLFLFFHSRTCWHSQYTKCVLWCCLSMWISDIFSICLFPTDANKRQGTKGHTIYTPVQDWALPALVESL